MEPSRTFKSCRQALGMPILNADRTKSVLVLKRSMAVHRLVGQHAVDRGRLRPLAPAMPGPAGPLEVLLHVGPLVRAAPRPVSLDPMTQTSAIAILGVMLSSCSSGQALSEVDACKQVAATACEKVNTCEGAAALSSYGYASLAECVTRKEADCAVVSPICDSVGTYNPGSAESCIRSYSTESCADYDDLVTPTACYLMCESSAGVTWSAFCEHESQLFCKKVESCQGAAGLTSVGYASLAACVDAERAACSDPLPCRGLATYSPDWAMLCLSETRELACADFVNDTLPSTCESVCL